MIKVHVVDVNDNRPIFKQSTYNLNLARETEPLSVIVNVEAEDLDSGSFGRITYSIASGNDDQLFAIGPSTGRFDTYVVYVS